MSVPVPLRLKTAPGNMFYHQGLQYLPENIHR